MIGSATPSSSVSAVLDRVVHAPELARVATDDDLGGAHRHLAGEPHDTRDPARLHPARRARAATIPERAEHRAHVVLDADVLRELDLDVAHERMQGDLGDAGRKHGLSEIELDVRSEE